MFQTRRLILATAIAGAMAASIPAIAAKPLVMGFSQVGAESEWRTANTSSVKDAAKKAGVTLKFADAQQRQENQVKAIRSFIAQKVDVIAFSPVVESGWETVLREAKAAKIPVILTDRAVNVSDPSLYASFIGSDFVEEGRRAGKWLVERSAKMNKPVINVVELHRGRRPGDRPQEGLRGSHQGQSEAQDRAFADRRLHPRQGQGSHGSFPESPGQEHRRAVRA